MLFWKENKKTKKFFFEIKTEFIVTDANIEDDMTITAEYTAEDSFEDTREE